MKGIDLGPNFGKATFMSAAFFLLYIPANIGQDMTSEVQMYNGYGNFGFILIALLYLFQMIGSLFSPAIIEKQGVGFTIVFGSALMSTQLFSTALSTF